jgi:hypothetical protein
VDEDRFRRADTLLQQDFAYQQPGLLRRTTARSPTGDWVVIDLWRSPSDADSSVRRGDDDPTVQAFMALVDPVTTDMARYLELDA